MSALCLTEGFVKLKVIKKTVNFFNVSTPLILRSLQGAGANPSWHWTRGRGTSWTVTTTVILESLINLTPVCFCLLTMGGSQSTQRKTYTDAELHTGLVLRLVWIWFNLGTFVKNSFLFSVVYRVTMKPPTSMYTSPYTSLIFFPHWLQVQHQQYLSYFKTIQFSLQTTHETSSVFLLWYINPAPSRWCKKFFFFSGARGEQLFLVDRVLWHLQHKELVWERHWLRTGSWTTCVEKGRQ